MSPDPQDRNFDDLAHRFKRNVYDRLKGDIRLSVLQRDLNEFIPEVFMSDSGCKPLRVLDAGGGQAPLGLRLALAGHDVTVCDISQNMLSMARDHAEALGVADKVQFLHQSIQSVTDGPYDLVLCHAVLEWVAQPQVLLQHLCQLTAAGGFLSVSFYNQQSIVMKNLLRGNFGKVQREEYSGYRGSLTPTWPRLREDVESWLQPLPLERVCGSGIRCFHDYILDREIAVTHPEAQLDLELKLSRQEPWRSLARYIHVLSRKSLA